MSSVNISITKEVYETLKRLKREDESFSEVIHELTQVKDISRCYGILKDKKESLEIIEKEALKIRKGKWRRIEI